MVFFKFLGKKMKNNCNNNNFFFEKKRDERNKICQVIGIK